MLIVWLFRPIGSSNSDGTYLIATTRKTNFQTQIETKEYDFVTVTGNDYEYFVLCCRIEAVAMKCWSAAITKQGPDPFAVHACASAKPGPGERGRGEVFRAEIPLVSDSASQMPVAVVVTLRREEVTKP
jgi:hypothetical protein